MKMNEAENVRREIRESFKIVAVDFELGPLNFDFALTVSVWLRI
jgi:hypothetical protein